ncbi:ABC transporter ATP-binding protein [Clostridiaceae bacterium]|nr:ABC transporter ATP-binding protein [Clostridiaceae bacterium]RKI16132.1 ABC transporter ATP-binding protein [bacterium 1XD21-70]
MSHLLEIKDLQVQYHTEDGTVYALNHVDLELDDGETLGLVGETGAGKTTLAKSIMRLIPNPPGKIEGGVIEFDGKNLLTASDSEIRAVRGNQISMIFQDPMSSLNPVMRVGDQIAEVIGVHEKCPKEEAKRKALEMLETVGIPAERASDFPHQFSGGMKQRVVIAIALACNPRVLIADEPTTALDVTIQAQVLEMMRRLRDKYHTATLLITHDLGVVAQMCEKVAIIYAGEVVEFGTVHDIYKRTLHPYTEGLLGAIPQVHLNVHRLSPIDGLMPDPTIQRTGCPFADRCKYAFERCGKEHPQFISVGDRHKVRCFKAEKEAEKGGMD